MPCNKFCDLFPPLRAGEARLREMESIVAEAGRLTERHHSASDVESRVNFFADFVRAYREGATVHVAGATIPRDDAGKMMRAKDLEGEVLASFSPMISKIVSKVSSRFDEDPEDLVGEAFKGFFQALVHYTGGSRFSTFLYTCVERHLGRVCVRGAHIRVPDETRRITMRVVGRMGREGETFDEALESEGVPRNKVPCVVAAMSRVSTASDLDIRESDMATCTDRPTAASVMRAVDSAGLGRLERAVLQSFMEAPATRMGLSEGCKDLINPDTGRPYSRAAISSAWREARKKLARVLGDVA